MSLLGPELDIEAARRITDILLRITASLLLTPTSSLPLETEAEARAFARDFFVPIIEHGLSGAE